MLIARRRRASFADRIDSAKWAKADKSGQPIARILQRRHCANASDVPDRTIALLSLPDRLKGGITVNSRD
jgi:hypothetical protein